MPAWKLIFSLFLRTYEISVRQDSQQSQMYLASRFGECFDCRYYQTDAPTDLRSTDEEIAIPISCYMFACESAITIKMCINCFSGLDCSMVICTWNCVFGLFCNSVYDFDNHTENHDRRSVSQLDMDWTHPLIGLSWIALGIILGKFCGYRWIPSRQ